MASDAPRPNRGPSAAAENRVALVAAARARFAAEGLATPLSAIARDAGVGQGSLYRHFPDRLALAVAVFDENLDELEALVADRSSGVGALLDLAEQQAVVSPALVDLMWQHVDDERVAHLATRVTRIAEDAVEHDRARGAVDGALETADVLAAILLLADVTVRVGRIADAPGLATQAEHARRIVRRGLGLDAGG